LIRYWTEYPFASDTIEGIQRWWLLPADAVSASELAAAVQWLLDRQLIESTVAADGRVRLRRSAGFDAGLPTALQAMAAAEAAARH
jgi:hypothetical protein